MKFKQLQLAFIFLLASLSGRSTPYHWNCGTFTVDASDTLITCPLTSTNYIHFIITNTTASNIYVRQFINAVNLPAGWSLNMCNPNGCWNSNVLADSFLVPASGFVAARFDFHVDNNAGTGIANVRFDDAANPTIDGATFNLHAVTLGTGVNETADQNISLLLYPNPASNELIIQNAELRIENAEIFNTIGEKKFSQRQTIDAKQQTIDISQLPSGIYFVRVRGEKEE